MKHHRAYRPWLVATALLAVSSCEGHDELVQPSAQRASTALQRRVPPPGLELARLVALSLRDAETRATLFRAFQESPVAEGKLHVASHLRGTGRSLSLALARAGGTSQDGIEKIVSTLPHLEIYLPVQRHRAAWKGGTDVQVAIWWSEEEAPIGFDLAGERVPLTLDRPPTTPTIVITRSESFDGSGRPFTWSARSSDDRLRQMAEECTPDMDFCDGGGGGGGGGGSGSPSWEPPAGSTNQRGIGIRERISHLRAVDDLEGWPSGNPEFRLIVIANNDADAEAEITNVIPIPEDPWSGHDGNETFREWVGGLNMADWDVDYGTRALLACFEADGGDPNQTFELSTSTQIAPGQTVTFKHTFRIGEQDNKCAGQYALLIKTSTGVWTSIPVYDTGVQESGDPLELRWFGYGVAIP